MQIFTQVVPVVVALTMPFAFLATPASVIFFILSLIKDDMETKKKNRKIALYLLIPLVIVVVFSILWGGITLVAHSL